MKSIAKKIGFVAVGAALSLIPLSIRPALAGIADGFVGPWTGPGSQAVVTLKGSDVSINIPNRPPATGKVDASDPSKVTVNFPDDKTITGKLVTPEKIEWSNGTTWTRKLSFAGSWTTPYGGVVVTVEGTKLSVDMSKLQRPNATGEIDASDPTKATVNFPSDNTWKAVLRNPGLIEWSNNLVWKRQ